MTARPDRAEGVAVAGAETMLLVTTVVMAPSMVSVMRAAREKKMSTQALYVVVPMTMRRATYAAHAEQTMRRATYAAHAEQTMRRAMFAAATAPMMLDVACSAFF